MEDIASQISGRVMPSKFVDAARELRRDTDVQNRFIAHNLASPFTSNFCAMPSKLVDAARELRRDTDVQNRFIAHNLASPFSGVEGSQSVCQVCQPGSICRDGPMVLDLSRSEKDPEIQSQHLQD